MPMSEAEKIRLAAKAIQFALARRGVFIYDDTALHAARQLWRVWSERTAISYQPETALQ